MASFENYATKYSVRDGQVEQAVTFLKNAFGAFEISSRRAPDGRLISAKLKVAGSLIVVDVDPNANVRSTAIIETTDVESGFASAVAAGADSVQEVLEIYSGGVKRKLGKVRDPLGYIWVILSSRLTNMTSCALCHLPSHIPALCSKSLDWMQLNHDALDVSMLKRVRSTECRLLNLDSKSLNLSDFERSFEDHNEKMVAYYCRSLLSSSHFHLFELISGVHRMIQILRWVEVSLCIETDSGTFAVLRRNSSELERNLNALISILPTSDPLLPVWPVSMISGAFQLAATSVRTLLHCVLVSRVCVEPGRIAGLAEEMAAMKALIEAELEFWNTTLSLFR